MSMATRTLNQSTPVPVCIYHLRGLCKRGSQCTFDHNINSSANDYRSPKPPTSTTCEFFLRGFCRFGNQCRFLHPQGGTPEESMQHFSAKVDYVGSTTPRSPAPHRDNSQPDAGLGQWRGSGATTGTFAPCKFFAQGKCTKGAACPFSHVGSPTGVKSFVESRPQKQPKKTPQKTLSSNEIHAGVANSLSSRDPVLERDLSPDPSLAPRAVKDTTKAERMKFGCKVVFGAGASIEKITTAFESDLAVVSNLPSSVTQMDLITLAERFGDVLNLSIDTDTIDSSSKVRIRFVEIEHAVRAVRNLNGMSFRSKTLAARLDVRAVEDGTATLRSTKVKLSWYAPSRIAWAHYSGISFATKQAECLDGKTFSGRKIKASFQQPKFNQTKSFSVEIKGLPAKFAALNLKQFCHADSITVAKLPYEPTQCCERIQSLLRKTFSLDTLETLPADPSKIKLVAFAQFSSAEGAEGAVKNLNGSKHAFLGGSPLWLEHIHTIKYSIPAAQFTVLKVAIDNLRESQSNCKLRYYEVDDTGGQLDPICVRMYGTEPKVLGKMKAEMDRLLKGELLVREGVGIWDEFFASLEGQFFLRTLSRRTETFIKCDSRLRKLQVFGPKHQWETVRSAIFQKLAELAERRHVLPLDRFQLRSLVTGGLAKLTAIVGKDALLLDVVRQTLTIKSGTVEEIEKIRQIISSADNSALPADVHSDQDCPVCFCETTEPVELPCGHGYCKSCLQHLLRADPPTNSSGMTCIMETRESGKVGKCNKQIPYETIRLLLSPTEEDALLEAAFLSYIHTHPEEFHYCPTPDCGIIYRTGAEGTVLRCPSCIARICASCHVEFHEGQACRDYRDHITGGNDAFQRWREENGVKACPKCKADLEKNGGCNHMTCARCGTHMCWVCMETFTDQDSSGGVYAHMRRAHGGIM